MGCQKLASYRDSEKQTIALYTINSAGNQLYAFLASQVEMLWPLILTYDCFSFANTFAVWAFHKIPNVSSALSSTRPRNVELDANGGVIGAPQGG